MPDLKVLDNVRVASPCSASWDQMEGDEQVRFCRHCDRNVYNLSGMSRQEAEALVRDREGRLCVRFYRRRDGTLLTDNCPVGLRRARRWLLAHVGGITAAFGLVALLGSVANAATFKKIRHSQLAQTEPFRTVFEWIDPTPAPTMGRVAIMGAMAAPPPGKPGGK